MWIRKKENIGLYIHFPFCLNKCPYCGFYSLTPSFSEKEYFSALTKEFLLIKNFLQTNLNITDFSLITFYAGGGTPSLFSPYFFERLFEFLYKHSDFIPSEITLEANPETLSLEKLKDYKNLGFNRISLGVQSLSEKGLKFLGRIHNVKTSLKAIEWIQKSGFENYSLDFIFAWKGQGEKTLEKEIKMALKFSPPHFSFYELTIEKNTPFEKKYGSHKTWINEKKLIKLYQIIENILQKNGYTRYEISNYAKPGFECKHNLLYWELKPYIGLGPSAVSKVGLFRWQNPPDLKHYYNSLNKNLLPLKIIEKLDNISLAKEYLFMGLRLKKGISLKYLKEHFKAYISEESIELLIKKGLIEKNKDCITLTFKGKLLHNQIVSFLWDFLDTFKE